MDNFNFTGSKRMLKSFKSYEKFNHSILDLKRSTSFNSNILKNEDLAKGKKNSILVKLSSSKSSNVINQYQIYKHFQKKTTLKKRMKLKYETRFLLNKLEQTLLKKSKKA